MTTDTPLAGASDGDLALAVEENAFALFRAMARLPGGEIVETEKISYHYSFPKSPIFKGAWRARIDEGEADAVIDEAVAWFKARGAPHMLWWIGPRTRAPGLRDRLMARGFTGNIIDSPGMALDLRAFDSAERMPAGFRVAQATSTEEMEDWRDVFCEVYETPRFEGQAWIDAASSAAARGEPWRLYVGYLEGEPVATNMVFDGAGVAGVFAVGTVERARGRGIGAAITLGPLVAARERGYNYGVLYSSDMGYTVYRRLGFRDLGCKITRYLLLDP
jgi:hypothetical protein